PRDYNLKLNKKVKQLARKSALSYKAAENGIIILEDFNIETPKTHEMVKITDNLQLSSKKSIFVLPKQNKNIYLSSRNLQGVEVVTVSELNTYKIMNASILVLSEGAIDILQKTFKN
ncbi:MAG TPA: 50S ribosomal protein L4, partial [Bacteroidales bacterium]|nr:50S ribosomal protein L4 [Bacteroidales bacterium]